jgi:short-chain fatty acids transporter
MFTAYVAMIGGLLNWGLGLILGAMTAREMGKSCAKRGVPIHYPLICAAGYTGLLVWHGGLSGTAPLKVTRASELIDVFGAEFVQKHDLAPLSLYDTLGSSLNLWVMGWLLLLVPLSLAAMLPREISDYQPPPSDLEHDDIDANQEGQVEDQSEAQNAPHNVAYRLERSRVIAYLFAALIIAYTYRYLRLIGFGQIDLNVINLVFVGLGLVAYGAPIAYGQAIERATRGCSGILIQFPLYAGLMAVMSASGITQTIAQGFTQIATAESMSTLSFFSAGLINLFVPSGGGQWAVQGPLLLESAYQVGAPLNEVVMAFAYGDAWTNMLQPFWALPLLVLTGVKARDIVGYTATLMLMVTPVYVLGFWVL